MPFSPVEDILEEIKAGHMVIVCDDEDRENEGDLTMAAELVTADDINFMALYGRGLICLPLSGDIVDKLEIPEMAQHNHPLSGTAFTASIEAREGISTGISAADRAHTCRVAVEEGTGPDDLVMPGHIFPLRARPGGVLQRAGQTEAAVDLSRLAGFKAAGVICEVMNEDGTMARVPDLERFSVEHGVKMVTVAQIIEYRRRYERHVKFAVETRLPTPYGEFRLRAYENDVDTLTHLALVMGEPEGKDNVLVYVHPACFTGDVFHSLWCGCKVRLEAAMARVQREGEGVIVYAQHEWRDGLPGEALTRCPQDASSVAETESSGVAERILEELGLKRVRYATGEADGVAEPRDYESSPVT